MASDQEREHALSSFKAKLIESREWEAKLKALRLDIKGLQRDFDQTEDNIKALQSVGQIIGEVLKQLDDERCAFSPRRATWCFFDAMTNANIFFFFLLLQLSSRPPPDRDTWSGAAPKSTRPSSSKVPVWRWI